MSVSSSSISRPSSNTVEVHVVVELLACQHGSAAARLVDQRS